MQLLLLGGVSVCWYHSCFVQPGNEPNWDLCLDPDEFSDPVPPAASPNYASMSEQDRALLPAEVLFGWQCHRHSEKIQLDTCLEPVLLFQMILCVFSWYLTECKFQISFYMSEAGNSCISLFQGSFFFL